MFVVVISFSVTPNLSFCQFDAIPDSNARWLVYVFLGPDHIDDFLYRLSNVHADTLIHGMDFTRLYAGSSDTEIGALNENGTGQVFYHEFSTDSTYLLYDFNVQIGDTLHNVFTEQEIIDTIYIVDVDSIEYGGKWRKRIGITVEDGISFPDGYWVQGIGAVQNGTNGGGVLTGCPCSTLSATFRLECVSASDTIQYGNNEGMPGQCYLLPGMVENRNSPDISILPGSFPGTFRIDHSQALDIEVFNSTGALVVQTNGQEFDVSAQPPGIYIVRLRDKHFVWSQKVLR